MLRFAPRLSCALLIGWSFFVPSVQAQTPLPSVSEQVRFDREASDASLTLESQANGFRGTLLLCGGGALPIAIRREFHDIAQGPQGSLVVIPTASPRSDAGDFTAWLDYWENFQWSSIEVLHVASREQAFDPAQAAKLQKATAVWVSGGDQRRLTERYVGTPIEQELHALLARGGIIGGTSAGAAIASTTMISGGLTEPQFAAGLHFLPNIIVDQHFSQKNRMQRLTKAVEINPNRIGLGIDESTGVFIDRDRTRVVGDGQVYLVEAPHVKDEPEEKIQTVSSFRQLMPGEQVDSQGLRVSSY